VAIAESLSGNKNASDRFFAGTNDAASGADKNEVITRIK
jgi:hypothetical protein